MGSINSDEIISILRSEIEDYDVHARDQEVGTVIGIGDGIATIYGIDHAMYGEIVIFDNGVKGMVQDIRRDDIGCILFGSDREIKEQGYENKETCRYPGWRRLYRKSCQRIGCSNRRER